MEQSSGEQPKKHTQFGILALVTGLLGIILFWIAPPPINIIALIFSMLALIFGYKAKKQGDNYGLIGLILGIITLVLVIFIVIAAALYALVSGMTGSVG